NDVPSKNYYNRVARISTGFFSFDLDETPGPDRRHAVGAWTTDRDGGAARHGAGRGGQFQRLSPRLQSGRMVAARTEPAPVALTGAYLCGRRRHDHTGHR